MGRTLTALTAVALVAVTLMPLAQAAEDQDTADPRDAMNEPRIAPYIVGEKHTGYVYSTPETRDLQDDDFLNQGFLWVEMGEENWSKVEGKAGKSCQSCHDDAEESMKGVSVTYPKVDAESGDLMSLQHRINTCRTENMQADPWKWEGDDMLGMAAYVKLQSRGMPINVTVDGAAKPFFEKGRDFYFTRRGQLDLACIHCHYDHPGEYIRADLLSQGMPNGFPTYRLKWQSLGSLHRRFRGCNKNIRAEPYKQGSPEYTALELFVSWRANGLPSEAPSVRR